MAVTLRLSPIANWNAAVIIMPPATAQVHPVSRRALAITRGCLSQLHSVSCVAAAAAPPQVTSLHGTNPGQNSVGCAATAFWAASAAQAVQEASEDRQTFHIGVSKS